VENRPGAGGTTGTAFVAKSDPDGYTILVFSSAHTINPSIQAYTLLLAGTPNAVNVTLYDKLSFNFLRDVAPVASIIRAPYVMAVNPTVPARTIPELIAYAKANPGKFSMGSTGTGSGAHVAGELFQMITGTHLKAAHLDGSAARGWRGDRARCLELLGRLAVQVRHVRVDRRNLRQAEAPVGRETLRSAT
jgi:tripartite-type tricarboxylate transporter receptor subunit TctC